ncbi:MAG: hypothetical protein E7022_03465 [Desulfovibrio desulfuricans]|jgi:3-oxoacyl-[acyl-carrier-protein] synthase II|nr:hypothetical protein [Desulfovibrio desulfuricans]
MTAVPFLSVAGVGLVHSIGGTDALESLHLPGVRGAPGVPAEGGKPPRPDISRLAGLFPGGRLRRAPFYARMALLSALDALEQAGWRQEAQLRRTALTLGTAFSGAQMSMDFMDSILDNGPQLSSPTAFSHAVNNMGTGLLSLLLGIRGPCLTISQFELSFAGALSAAAVQLGAGRVDAVLAGAVDEVDARFTACCPQLTREGFPRTEGAAFVCLTRERPGLPRLRVLWEQEAEPHVPVFASGAAAAGGEGEDHEPQFGHGPLTQALDVLLALGLTRRGASAAVDCLCRSASGGRQACIQIRSAP